MNKRQFPYEDTISCMESRKDDFNRDNERLLDVPGWTETEANVFSNFIQGLQHR